MVLSAPCPISTGPQALRHPGGPLRLPQGPPGERADISPRRGRQTSVQGAASPRPRCRLTHGVPLCRMFLQTYVIDKGVVRMVFNSQLDFNKHVEEALETIATIESEKPKSLFPWA